MYFETFSAFACDALAMPHARCRSLSSSRVHGSGAGGERRRIRAQRWSDRTIDFVGAS